MPARAAANRLLGSLVIATVCVASLAAEADRITYPADFTSWTFVKTGPSPARGGIHHIYANEKALAGYRAGQFPDGSVVVFEIVSAQGERKLIDVMLKDAQKYAPTGGWGYEEFPGAGPIPGVLTEQAKVACFTCHIGRKARDYVFSSLAR